MAPLGAAARSRGEADWLVGMNGTRAATKVGRLEGVVSLGRVQTPTLALIVRRDLEIDAFVPETYFQVDARFQLDQERTYLGRWFEGKEDRTSEHERAQAVADAASGADASVLSVKRNERKTRPPLLYDLTSLQREANSRYGLSAQRTLAAAQRLYEGSAHGAVITYPRTRSQFLPSDQIPTLKRIAGLAGRHRRVQAPRRVRGRRWTCCRWPASSTTARSTTTTPSSPPATCRAASCPTTTAASTTWSAAATWPCSTPRPASRTPRS